jgi:hypothetical protein
VLMVLFSILRTCALALITFPIAFVLHVFAVFLLPWEITKATASEIFSHRYSMKKTKTNDERRFRWFRRRRRRMRGKGDEKSGHDIARVSTHPREREWFYHQSFVFRWCVKTTNVEYDAYVLEVLSRAT